MKSHMDKTMRYKNTTSALAFITAAAALAACGDANANPSAANAELQRDLQLASATALNLATPAVDQALLQASMETKPQAAPEPRVTLRRASGPRVVESDEPTIRAEPVEEIAASDDVVEEVLTSAAAETIDEPVAVVPVSAPPAGDYGTGINGGGAGVYGGGTGTILRGGGIDGDDCRIHRRGGGVIYTPTYPRTGGITVNDRRPSTGIGSRDAGRTSARPMPSGTRSSVGRPTLGGSRIGTTASSSSSSPRGTRGRLR